MDQHHILSLQDTPGLDPGSVNYGEYSHESFLLDSLVADVGERHDFHDFQLDAVDFNAPANLGHESRAFPPLEIPENTPTLLPASSRNASRPAPVIFQSPILPSQNSKSYNQEHLIQKQRHQRSRLSTPLMARTLHSAYTPLASPAVTPLELQMSTRLHAAPAATDFEPLTSPALKAQLHASSSASSAFDSERRRSLTAFAANDYARGKSAKRRTPHLTPNLQVAPLKLKRSPSLRMVPQADSAHADSQKLHSSDLTPMLPPQGKKAVIDSSLQIFNLGPSSSPSAGFGPATLMGFTMNRLAEQQQGRSSENGLSIELAPHSAPTLAPTSAPAFTSLSETSPVLEAMSGIYGEQHTGSKRDRFPAKKASHKIAEQGRRIRMNQAVHDLARLIPEYFHERVAVPSKATTIELAAAYIRDLHHEIDTLKNQNRN